MTDCIKNGYHLPWEYIYNGTKWGHATSGICETCGFVRDYTKPDDGGNDFGLSKEQQDKKV